MPNEAEQRKRRRLNGLPSAVNMSARRVLATVPMVPGLTFNDVAINRATRSHERAASGARLASKCNEI
jgi:hypothetical protein